ncbi:hypothetical protein Taro_021599 [Colocasia esculenta]|uniref:Aminotransferase-like plant mobile domain-containing protein n=1 Tax=Colocasia esculenta TaxID=4460 RepID=A0A843URX5_COLES|nr:hypothetical protein [Colocasia esculenta]
MRGFTICLAGLLLFPSIDNILEKDQLSVVCGIWEGERLGPAVPAFLCSGLTSFDVNNEIPSSSRIFSKSPLQHLDNLVGLEGRVANQVPELKMRVDWRDHLRSMPKNAFTCTLAPLLTRDLRTRLAPGVDLRLIGASKFVLYNPHHCLSQLGLPWRKFEGPSHLSPIKRQKIRTNNDGEEADTIKALWKICSFKRPVPHVEEVEDEWMAYVRELLKIWPKVAGVMRPRLQWPLVLAAYQGLPDFQRERVWGMGFGPILEIEPFYLDSPLITGLRVDGEAVTGVTYADYTEHTHDLLGLEPMGEDELGDQRMVDRIVLLESLGLCGDPEDRERVDRDLRRILVLFLGKMLLGTKGDGIHCQFLEILEDLEQVGQYAWGAAFLAHTFADLSSGTGRETTVWSYYYIPLGRVTEVRPDALPLVRRWLPVVTVASFSLQLDTLRRDIRGFPELLVLWKPYAGVGDDGLHQVWHDEVDPKGIVRRTRGKAKRVDWCLCFPDQYADWQCGGYPVESDAVDSFAYLQRYQEEYRERDFMRPVRDAWDGLIVTLRAQLASTDVTPCVFRIPMDPGVAHVVRLGGPPGWAQSAHRFSACERDRGMRRVLNATALAVAFLLPPLSVDVCMRTKCHALGGLLTSGGELLWGFSGWLDVQEVRGACSRREDVVRSGGTHLDLMFGSYATTLGVALLTRQLGASRSDFKRAISKGRVLMVTKDPVAQGRASALVMLMERIVHELGKYYVVNVLFGPFVRDCETERLFLCCVVRSRFDPFEVCPGVGTVVTAVVACGVPVPCVGNGLWWYVVYQSVLVLTWNCASWRSCGVTFHSMCFTLPRISLARLRSVRGRRIWIWSFIEHKYPGLSQRRPSWQRRGSREALEALRTTQTTVECTYAAGVSTSRSVLDPGVSSLREQLAAAVAQAEATEHDVTARSDELQSALTRETLASAEVTKLSQQLSELRTQVSQHDADLPCEATEVRLMLAVEQREPE